MASIKVKQVNDLTDIVIPEAGKVTLSLYQGKLYLTNSDGLHRAVVFETLRNGEWRYDKGAGNTGTGNEVGDYRTGVDSTSGSETYGQRITQKYDGSNWQTLTNV